MKPKRNMWIGGLGGCLLAAGLLLQSKSHADRAEPPGMAMPRNSLTATAWFALTGDQLGFRIKLDSDGTGLFAFQDLKSPVHLYSVKKWSINSTNLVIELKGLGDASPLRVEGVTSYSALTLKVSQEGWSRTLRMVNESEFEERLGPLRFTMRHVQKN